MNNPRAPRPILPRPDKCPVCKAAIAWHTIVYQGRRIDEYRCLNGHETGEGAVERVRG